MVSREELTKKASQVTGLDMITKASGRLLSCYRQFLYQLINFEVGRQNILVGPSCHVSYVFFLFWQMLVAIEEMVRFDTICQTAGLRRFLPRIVALS